MEFTKGTTALEKTGRYVLCRFIAIIASKNYPYQNFSCLYVWKLHTKLSRLYYELFLGPGPTSFFFTVNRIAVAEYTKCSGVPRTAIAPRAFRNAHSCCESHIKFYCIANVPFSVRRWLKSELHLMRRNWNIPGKISAVVLLRLAYSSCNFGY